MKTIQNTIVIVLLFIANAAAAQSFTKMQSTVRRPGEGLYESAAPAFRSTSTVQLAGNLPSAADPQFRNTNSLLNRKITVNPSQYKVAVNANPYAAPIAKGALTGGSAGFGGGSGTVSGGPGTGAGEDKGETAGGDLNLNPTNPNPDSGSGEGGSNNGFDRPLGELSPIGDALIPFLLLLLIYALFLLVRGEVRDDQELA